MTTEKEMTAAEHAQMARDFLAASDREFADGDHLQGSEKLYGAATQAIIAICQQRGWGYRSHRAMKNAVIDLGREYDDPFIVAGFATGNCSRLRGSDRLSTGIAYLATALGTAKKPADLINSEQLPPPRNDSTQISFTIIWKTMTWRGNARRFISSSTGCWRC